VKDWANGKFTTLSEVNNNADVPNANYADNAGDADTVDGFEGSDLKGRYTEDSNSPFLSLGTATSHTINLSQSYDEVIVEIPEARINNGDDQESVVVRVNGYSSYYNGINYDGYRSDEIDGWKVLTQGSYNNMDISTKFSIQYMTNEFIYNHMGGSVSGNSNAIILHSIGGNDYMTDAHTNISSLEFVAEINDVTIDEIRVYGRNV
jgi:hypothetical protein